MPAKPHIFVVTGNSRSYDMGSVWVAGVFRTQSAAIEFVRKADRIAQDGLDLDANGQSKPRPAGWHTLDPNAPNDEDGSWVGSGISYSIVQAPYHDS